MGDFNIDSLILNEDIESFQILEKFGFTHLVNKKYCQNLI